MSGSFPVFVKPYAGLPRADGSGYDITPQLYAMQMKPYRELHLFAAGGCCGTTPAHIFELSKIVGGYAPRPLPAPRHETVQSGQEPLRIVPAPNIKHVGESTNVAG